MNEEEAMRIAQTIISHNESLLADGKCTLTEARRGLMTVRHELTQRGAPNRAISLLDSAITDFLETYSSDEGTQH